MKGEWHPRRKEARRERARRKLRLTTSWRVFCGRSTSLRVSNPHDSADGGGIYLCAMTRILQRVQRGLRLSQGAHSSADVGLRRGRDVMAIGCVAI